jgi:hemolysin activation/secretion protein
MNSLRCFFLTLSLALISPILLAEEYVVDEFRFSYGNPRSGLPELAQLGALEVNLQQVDGVWSKSASGEGQTVRLSALPSGAVFDGDGLNAVMAEVVRFYKQQDFMGVFVVPAEGQIDARTGRDLRRGSGVLDLAVWVGKISELRTVARGTRFFTDDSINRPQHRRISENSPLAAALSGEEPSQALYKIPISDYLTRLNRHPGRRVDLAISAGENPGDIIADMIVNEQKPWFVYGQIANTGPESTGEWRGRVGAVHYQITNADDILTADVISDFKDTYAASISYSRPLVYPDRLGFRISGRWTDYTAADFGGTSLDYSGTTYSLDAELYANPLVWRKITVELTAGVRYQDISTSSVLNLDGESLTVTDANGELILPFVGLSLFRSERAFAFEGGLRLEANVNSIDEDQIDGLGRLFADDDFVILTGGLQGRFFLDPILGRKARGPGDEWKNAQLAHEIRLRLNGQYAFGNRVFAQTQFVTGGMDRVRGYPESIAAGDNGIQGSIEYAFHIPRAFKPLSEISTSTGEEASRPMLTSPFLGRYNLRPPSLYSLPDWDFVLKAFLDAGSTYVNGTRDNSEDEELAAAGIGVELQLSSMASLEVDWGMALTDTDDGTESGDTRIHLRAQLTW